MTGQNAIVTSVALFPGDGDDVEDAKEEMGDIDYYRAEVGEEPEPGTHPPHLSHLITPL